jgi:hypothetical protein
MQDVRSDLLVVLHGLVGSILLEEGSVLLEETLETAAATARELVRYLMSID